VTLVAAVKVVAVVVEATVIVVISVQIMPFVQKIKEN